MFSVKRLKKKSQSVDIPTHPLDTSLIRDIARTTLAAVTTKDQENNSPNNQRVRSNTRRGELKRGYTIDTGQKGRAQSGSADRKDVRRVSFQRPRGTTEYCVDPRDTLNSIALKFDTTPNELVQLNKLFSRAVVPGKVLYVPDPNYVSSPESSPSLSPNSPASPSSSDPDLKDSDEGRRKDATPTPGHPRQARVVSSTSEEDEVLNEKFIKVTCKYITYNQGIVSGVLLVTPNNLMFDPYKSDPLVVTNGCEEYGIMCPLQEVMSVAMCTEVTDPRLREILPLNLELPPVGLDPGPMRRVARSNLEAAVRAHEAGNDSASTAPRSTEASLSEDVFTESELSPVRDLTAPSSSDELPPHKSSGASSESVLTINLEEPADAASLPRTEACSPDRPPRQAPGLDEASSKEGGETESRPQEEELRAGAKRESESPGAQTCTSGGPDHVAVSKGVAEARNNSISQGSDTVATDQPYMVGPDLPNQEQNQDGQSEMDELRKLWKSHALQTANDQALKSQLTADKANTANQEQSETEPGRGEAGGRLRRSAMKFLCVRVGQAMRKTFVSAANASMLQYAQRDRSKHEYWFAVPPQRSDHLFAFFVQWSPESFGEEGAGGRPGFVVVKKNREAELDSEQPPVPDISSKDWEVVSVSEYQRRIDALNSEDLKSLCRRLQITTKEEASQNQGLAVKTDLESEVFRPTLSEPSDLLTSQQIEKLAKHLPPRTIGYPWTLAFGTAKHGMSIKSLYRSMRGLDTPVLMVVRDGDGQVFGALASEPFKVSDAFYGTGETFLFTFSPEFEVFKWTGDNMFFLKGDSDSLAFGGGGGEFALWLDGDLYHGRSNSCRTFGNPRLSVKEDFILQDIEIWAFE